LKGRGRFLADGRQDRHWRVGVILLEPNIQAEDGTPEGPARTRIGHLDLELQHLHPVVK